MDRNVTPFKINVKARRKYKPFKKQGILTKRQIMMLGEWILNPKTRFVGNEEIAKMIGKSKPSLWRTIKKGGKNPLNEFTLGELDIILGIYNKDVLKKIEYKSDGTLDKMSNSEKDRLKQLLEE